MSAGTYVLSVTDGNGCVTSSEMVLTEPEPFTIGFEIAEPDCFDQQLGTITVQSNGGVAPYTYSLDGGSVQASPVFNGLGEGVYQVTAIDANDCHATEIISLNVPLMVDVELGDDHFISIGDSVIIQAIVNLPFDSIASLSWTGVDSAHCQGCLIQLVAPVITTSYSVSVISMDGCTDQDSLNILVNTDSGMYIPNVFSPNGDGINDVFSFTLRDDVTEISSFSIFDRWGNMTYSVESILPSDPSKAWDGKMNGQLMNPGVFTYKLILKMKDGSLDVRYGDITLIR